MSTMNSLSLDTSTFSELPVQQLLELKEKLKKEKNRRQKQFIKPVEEQHLKPLKDQYIKPLREEYINPINKILRELNKYIPKKDDKQVYFVIDGKKYGPSSRGNFMKMFIDAE